ncbi:von Willebrand factor A domain-containing 7-like [Brachionus plicatilis]|uniref:von Willebrand factor A domain-containing 7-like n=1 Tax=Brachionus plicatilis TaxID=10195 RepID=A0A3M7QNS2_BRAPC|nr:von Willebrand factor A domain-containing 7-like [Brachionus plicatilis]
MKFLTILSLILILNVLNAFKIDSNKILTKKAIFQITAEIFRIPLVEYENAAELFSVAFGSIPSNLSSSQVVTTKPFEKSINEIDTNMFKFKFHSNDINYNWKMENINSSLEKLESIRDTFYVHAEKFNQDYMRAELAKMLVMHQDFYTNTNWLENGHSDEAAFLQDSSAPLVTGVNGASLNGKEEPDHPDHNKAQQLALLTSISLLKSIRTRIGLRKFKLLLGIEGGKTIAFNIDDTGSMSSMIKAAKEHAIMIGLSYSGSRNPPQKYMLQSFNDPTIGELIISSDISVIEKEINKLVATGGGDTPELCLSGLIEVINHLEDNSYAEIFVYTDAPAKDTWLMDELKDLVSKKLPRISFLLNMVPTRASATQAYDLIKEFSNGDVLYVTPTNIKSSVDFLIAKADVSSEQLLQLKNLKRGEIYNFSVDPTIDELRISIDARDFVFVLKNPDGVAVSPTVITDLVHFKMFKVKSPKSGTWSLNVQSFNSIGKMKLEGSTSIAFDFKFVAEINSDLIDGLELKGQLPLNTRIGAIVNVFGSDASKPKVNYLEILKENGELIERISLQKYDTSKFYAKSFLTPSSDFVVKLIATDETGNSYQRMVNDVFHVTTLTAKTGLRSIRNDVYSINFEINNLSGNEKKIKMKVEICDDFSMDDFYKERQFVVYEFDYFSDVVILKKKSSNSDLCNAKLIFSDQDTGNVYFTKVVDMNYLEW